MYLQAIPLLFRNPALLLAPLFTGVLGVLVQMFGGQSAGTDITGGFMAGILQLLIFLFNCFGLAISVIIADQIWRNGKGSFEDGWEEGRRKAGDIFLAALGLNFIIIIAQQFGGYINWMLGLGLAALAFYFLIYTIPAAAVGGIPGFMALNTSVERVHENYLSALALAVCFVVLYGVIGMYVVPLYSLEFVGTTSSLLIGAAVRAIALGYFSLVLARGYTDAAFVRRRF